MSKFKLGDKIILSTGEKWANGDAYRTITRVDDSHNETKYYFGSIAWYDSELELYKGKRENMEKTYGEVLKDIQEGETWDVISIQYNVRSVTLKKGILEIISEEKRKVTMLGMDVKLKLRRNSYDFQTALDEMKEGAIIESVESGINYKIYARELYTRRNDNDHWVGTNGIVYKEIENKWYINQ